MVLYPSDNNYNKPGSNNPSLLTFDLQAEKQRIGDGTEEIRQELSAAWQKKYAQAQIFPNKLSSTNTELIEFILSFKSSKLFPLNSICKISFGTPFFNTIINSGIKLNAVEIMFAVPIFFANSM